jgi:sigma-E factor negative regulatory protein RseC
MGQGELLTAMGRVEKIEGAFAYIRTQRESGCGQCQASAGCGQSVLSTWFNAGKPDVLRLPNTLNSRPGDWVELALAAQDLSRQALLAYGLPLFGFFSAAIAAHYWLVEDWLVGVASLFGLVLGLVALRLFHRPTQPRMVKIVTMWESIKQ